MKKILSAILAMCFTFTASASTGAIQGLEQALNDYQYTMTVEWDQKDEKFRNQATQALNEKVKSVLASQSISRDELLKLLSKKIVSKKQLEALTVKMALLPKTLTEEQQIAALMSSVDTGAQGASWNGNIVGPALAVIMVAAMLLVIANQIQQGDCVEESTELEETCDDGGCYEYYPCLRRENESWW